MDTAVQYARELASPCYKPLPYEVERELLIKYSQGDHSVTNRLVCSNLRFVAAVARGFSVPDNRADLMDLIQEGNYGLIYSIPRFKIIHDCRLCSYALHWIKFYIRTLVLSNEFKVSVLADEYPEVIGEMKTASEVAREDLHKFLQQFMSKQEAYVLMLNFYGNGEGPLNLEEISVRMRCTAMNVLYLRKSGLAKLKQGGGADELLDIIGELN